MSRCQRARVWAALAPDGELAVLEWRLLDAHLAHCFRCRAFAADVAAVAADLRSTAVERCSRRLVVPAAPLRRPARLRNVASAAVVAAMAFGTALQSPAVVDRDRPARPASTPPAKVESAELQTLRLLRRDEFLNGLPALGRTSGAFGNRPA